MNDFLDQVYFSNAVRTWAWALAVFLFTFTVLPLSRRFVLSHRVRFEGVDAPGGVDLLLLLITRTKRLFLWIVALYLAERQLALPAPIERAFDVVIVLVAWTQVAIWGVSAVRFGLERQQQRAIAAGDMTARGSLGIVLFVSRIVIFSVAALIALDNLGVNITALVAGLGVGGIAIALAVQTILGDLLASLSIALDKPFAPGDSLRVDDIEGVVESIGVKSTRLRSVSGEQIILSNADLLRSRVRNMGRMPERRALFTLGVAYETPPERLAQVPCSACPERASSTVSCGASGSPPSASRCATSCRTRPRRSTSSRASRTRSTAASMRASAPQASSSPIPRARSS